MTIFSNPGRAKQFSSRMSNGRDPITFSSSHEGDTEYSTATSTSNPTSTSRHTPDIFKRLVYKHRYGTEELHTESLDCLKSGEYLKDNIVQFYLVYLWNSCSDRLADRIHIFDTIFYSELDKIFGPHKVDTDKLKQLSKWYCNIDIFSKDFLIFPVCHEDHWFVIVVCYPNEVRETFKNYITNGYIIDDKDDEVVEMISDDEPDHPMDDDREIFHNAVEDIAQIDSSAATPPDSNSTNSRVPCIIVMDSLGVKNIAYSNVIRDFLDFEWRSRLNAPLKRFHQYDLKDYYPSLPKQPNAFDCGMYICYYLRCFLDNPYDFCALVRHNTYRSKRKLRSRIQTYIDEIDRDRLRSLIVDICIQEQS